MLKDYSKSILFILGISITVFIINSEASAVPYTYDESAFTIPWTNVVDPIVTVNSTGFTSMFTVVKSGNDYIFTKSFGNGVGGTITDANSFYDISVKRNMVGMMFYGCSGTTCTIYAHDLNLDNGTTTSWTSTTVLTSPNTIDVARAFITNDATGNDVIAFLETHHTASGNSAGNCTNGTASFTCHSGLHANNGLHAMESYVGYGSQRLLEDKTSAATGHGADTDWRSDFGNCFNTSCVALSSNNPTAKTWGTTAVSKSTYTAVSRDVPMYRQGIEIWTESSDTLPLWSDYFADIVNDPILLNLHYILLGETQPTYTFLMNNNGTEYVAKITSTGLSYVSSSFDFSDRAVQRYLVDDPSIGLPALATTTNLINPVFNIVTPTSTVTGNMGGLMTLLSGYSTTVTGITNVQNPSFDNNNVIVPMIVTTAGGTTSLSVHISNLPTTDYSIAFRQSNSFNGTNYQWDNIQVTAEKSATVDITSSLCVNIYIIDISVIGGQETSMGTLCASGTMPKELVFSQNLAFTFWTLEWGAAHNYDQDSSMVTTKVRNTNQAFDYTVNLYHNNGTIASTNLYSANTTDYDARILNTTNIDLPGRLEVLDDTGAIFYYATIGFPNYFSSVSSYFSQWFVVDGFNLLYMLPIVFAAMFTRNSVGLGTGMTVAFISMLAWLGVIAIDEVVVLALVVIAVLGMLAYRQLRS